MKGLYCQLQDLLNTRPLISGTPLSFQASGIWPWAIYVRWTSIMVPRWFISQLVTEKRYWQPDVFQQHVCQTAKYVYHGDNNWLITNGYIKKWSFWFSFKVLYWYIPLCFATYIYCRMLVPWQGHAKVISFWKFHVCPYWHTNYLPHVKTSSIFIHIQVLFTLVQCTYLFNCLTFSQGQGLTCDFLSKMGERQKISVID